MADLVIRNGTVVDGTGAPGVVADVAIDGGLIVEVAPHIDGRGRREIDAEGQIVTPGWVDIHTHYDGQVTWDPEVSPSGWHGVTTVVTGNCGVGFAPADPSRREWLIQLMEGVEDIPGSALADGMTWNWETFPEYLDEVASMGRVLDVSCLLPHGSLRAYVMGDRGANQLATPEDIDLMHKLAREAVEAGAIGISTTRTQLHRAKDGEVAEGTYASAEELLGIGSALADAGRRVFSIASDFADPRAEFAWMEELARSNGIPVTFGVLQFDFAPDGWRRAIDKAARSTAAGSRLVPQVCGKPACVMIGWESNYHPFVDNSAYRDLVGRHPESEHVARLRRPEVRAAILAEQARGVSGLGAFLSSQPDRMFLFGDPPEYEPDPARAGVGAIAARSGATVEETIYDLMLGREGRELLYRPTSGYAYGNLDCVREMLLDPGTVLGLSDGGAHVGLLCDAALPTFMLMHWARDRTRGERIGLEEVVRMQTSSTAELYGFADRGVLAPGYVADVNVIDFDNLTMPAPEFAHDLPAGAKRFVQKVSGYTATVKSGAVVNDHDELTGERPGRLLRGPQSLGGARPVG